MKWNNHKRAILKEKCLAYLGGKKCKRCKDSSLPSYCYDFHHKNFFKEKSIAKLLTENPKWGVLIKELQKCEIYCANCHRIIHNKI